MSDDRETTTTTTTTPAPPPDAAAEARARDLAELGDYVRLLADRMGLKDWTFGVHEVPDRYMVETCQMEDMGDPPRFADLLFKSEYFDETPERRRLGLIRELIRCHTEEFATYAAEAIDAAGRDIDLIDGKAFDDHHDRARAAIAAAWAPCLPLPLVGLMRRAPLRGAEAGGETEGATR